jgi:transposase-like protein
MLLLGQAALDAFAQGPWGAKYPAIAQSWRRNWELVIPFFAFPEGVRRDHLHHECHRGAKLKAAPRRQNQRTFSL